MTRNYYADIICMVTIGILLIFAITVNPGLWFFVILCGVVEAIFFTEETIKYKKTLKEQPQKQGIIQNGTDRLMFCPSCGEKVLFQGQFCSKCGAQLEEVKE